MSTGRAAAVCLESARIEIYAEHRVQRHTVNCGSGWLRGCQRLVRPGGLIVTKTTSRVMAGVAVAALATAGVAAVIRHRQGQKLDPDDRAYLDELEARLSEVEVPGQNIPTRRVRRVVERLQRQQGVSVTRLRLWVTALRDGTLSPEQAIVAESDFEALEREADQGGA
jgi:hypothetical protein